MVTVRFAMVALISVAAAPTAAQDASALYETCFAAAYDQPHLQAHPGQRVQAINVYFQNFAGALLAIVTYTLRFGAKFGFSGDCDQAGGGFVCRACANDSCEAEGESFKILWSGGDSIELINDGTGVVAENAEGGRDYLRAGGENASFTMRRGPLVDCAW